MQNDNRSEERDGLQDLIEILIFIWKAIIVGGAGAIANIAVFDVEHQFSLDIPTWVNVIAFGMGAGICLLVMHRLMNDLWPFSLHDHS